MGLKDRFAARQSPQSVVPLRMDFSPRSHQLLRDVEAAQAALDSARARNLPDLAGLERRVEQSRAAADELYEHLVVEALPPAGFDELIEQHPPTDEQKAKAKAEGLGEPSWNPETLGPALLGACITKVLRGGETHASDMAEDDWRELIEKGPVSGGEVRYLLSVAMDINDRSPDPGLGKG